MYAIISPKFKIDENLLDKEDEAKIQQSQYKTDTTIKGLDWGI